MRLVVYRYTDGSSYAYETTDDGSGPLRELEGKLKPGSSLVAYAEVGARDNDGGLRTLLEAMDWLAGELKKRQEIPVQV